MQDMRSSRTTMAAARRTVGSQPRLVMGATSTSPSTSSPPCSGQQSTRTAPEAVPVAAGSPLANTVPGARPAAPSVVIGRACTSQVRPPVMAHSDRGPGVVVAVAATDYPEVLVADAGLDELQQLVVHDVGVRLHQTGNHDLAEPQAASTTTCSRCPVLGSAVNGTPERSEAIIC